MKLQQAIHNFLYHVETLCRRVRDGVHPVSEQESKAIKSCCETLLEEIDRQDREQRRQH